MKGVINPMVTRCENQTTTNNNYDPKTKDEFWETDIQDLYPKEFPELSERRIVWDYRIL